MTEELKNNLSYVNKILDEIAMYSHACHVLTFDQETICPPAAMEEQGEVTAFLSNKAFQLEKDEKYIEAAEYLYKHREELDNDFDKVLSVSLHEAYMRTKNITPEMQHDFSLIFNRAFVNWLEAKQKADFSIFAKSLEEVRDVQLKQISLNEEAKTVAYDNLLDECERNMTSSDLDVCFDECKKRLIPLLKRIMSSKKKIRIDFMSRTVTDEQQKAMAKYLLDIMKFDFKRGAFTTTEHPFTDSLGKNDERVTTHYYPDAFASSMYSIIHEGGHALFDMNQPKENWIHHIENRKTMGMHESVSRFYENRIGRSKEFVHLIYPKAKEIFSNVLFDVSENELYEALNIVQPSFIRTEADEFTYTFHIIIRYEIEKAIVNKEVDIKNLPELWNDKYEEYLGIRPSNDKEGILQDVHWSSGFGYFPTYALGNIYNAMYINEMKKDFNLSEAIFNGDFDKINKWMKEHVWEKADRLEPKTWIKDITGRNFTAKDFLDYLEEKYTEIYEL